MTVCLPFLPNAKPTQPRPSRCQKYEIQVLTGEHTDFGDGRARGTTSATGAAPSASSAPPTPATATSMASAPPAPAPSTPASGGTTSNGGGTPSNGTATSSNRMDHCGRLVYEDYVASKADHRGCVFIIGVTAENRVDLFSHKPYERHWNISHEDLSPMFFLAGMRGRIEDDEEKQSILILKAPQNVAEFFDLRETPTGQRSAELFQRMVHDEYVRVARKLIATGLNEEILTEITDARKFFPDAPYLESPSPFPLRLMAAESLQDGD
jgi:hypothetical protein